MDRAEQERLAVFGVAVAGKDARVTWGKVQQFLGDSPERPFLILKDFFDRGVLRSRLEEFRLGQYQRIFSVFCRFARMPPDWHWKAMTGITGRKTSHMVGLYTYPELPRIACLDRHVLACLRVAYPQNAHIIPVETPTDNYRSYDWCTDLFLNLADRLQLLPWELDKDMWRTRQQGREWRPNQKEQAC